MAAAENGALPGGKVGGVGDVVRDLPLALAELNCRTTVLTPEYGLFADAGGARRIDQIDVRFAGETLDIGILEIPGTDERVRHLAFQHPRFAPQGPRIYCHDSANFVASLANGRSAPSWQ